jgi:hypothetical protein
MYKHLQSNIDFQVVQVYGAKREVVGFLPPLDAKILLLCDSVAAGCDGRIMFQAKKLPRKQAIDEAAADRLRTNQHGDIISTDVGQAIVEAGDVT